MLLPRQRTNNKDKKWVEETVDAIITDLSFSHDEDIEEVINHYSGKINVTDYDYVTSAFGETKARTFPSKIRNYNILQPIINKFVGDRIFRPNDMLIRDTSSDYVSRQEAKRKERNRKALLNLLQYEVTGEEELKKEAQKLQSEDPEDELVISLQNLFDNVLENVDFFDKSQDLFLDFVLTGHCYDYCPVEKSRVYWETVPYNEMAFGGTPGTKYVEDMDYCVRLQKVTKEKLYDMFDELDEETMTDIDDYNNRDTHFWGNTSLGNTDTYKNAFDSQTTSPVYFDLYHVCWKAQSLVQYVKKYSVTGEEYLVEVDHRYIPEPGEEVTSRWINEVWECYRLGPDKYLRGRKLPVQRHDSADSSEVKLPYNGRYFGHRMSDNYSIGLMALPYQKLYNIIRYQFELVLNRNKGKMSVISKNQIPDDAEWSFEDWMYAGMSTGFLFMEPGGLNAEGEPDNFNQYTVLDMSEGQYLSQLIEVMRVIKQEMMELFGVTYQSLGQIKASETASNANASIHQSAVITEEMHRKFEHYLERVGRKIMDYARYAYKDGFTGSYISPEAKTLKIDIDKEDIQSGQIGVRILYSAEEQDRLKTIKDLSNAYLQNGGDFSTVIESMQAKSTAKIAKLVKEAEAKRQQAEQAQEEKEQKEQQEQRQFEMQKLQSEQKFEKYKVDNETILKERELDLKEQEMYANEQTNNAKLSTDQYGKEIDALSKEEDKRIKETTEQQKLDIEREKIKQKDREIKSKEYQKELDSYTKLKNPTSGENS